MSDNVAYFGDWRARSYTCECGWAGPSTDLDSEPFDELAQYSGRSSSNATARASDDSTSRRRRRTT